jgi:hypothetical protein
MEAQAATIRAMTSETASVVAARFIFMWLSPPGVFGCGTV